MSGPVTDRDRLDSLDVLRGFAVLGILVMNIQFFANVEAAYNNPTVGGPFTGWDRWIWTSNHFLADMKFVTIFSALFGAGVVLMTSRREEMGQRARGLHYRRTLWLLLFGLCHAYLIWRGDILVWYALTALWLYPFRRRRPKTLIIWGVSMIAFCSIAMLVLGWSTQFWPPETVQNMLTNSWNPPAEAIQHELDIFRGTYTEQFAHRAPKLVGMQTFMYLMFGAWRIGGTMLLGMALLKLGILSAGRSKRFYAVMVALAVFVGFPLVVMGVWQNTAHNWEGVYPMFIGLQFNYWGSMFIAGGWIGVVMLIFKSGRLHGLTDSLAAVGRMAFSNYIGQSIICTTIFYGWGGGLFGYVDRVGQMLVVFSVFVLQLTVSPLWLHYFRFGPLEWLWRSLTYWRVQPMRRAVPARPAAGTAPLEASR